MQLRKGARWVEIIDEKCLKMGELPHVQQGCIGEALVEVADPHLSSLLSVPSSLARWADASCWAEMHKPTLQSTAVAFQRNKRHFSAT